MIWTSLVWASHPEDPDTRILSQDFRERTNPFRKYWWAYQRHRNEEMSWMSNYWIIWARSWDCLINRVFALMFRPRSRFDLFRHLLILQNFSVENFNDSLVMFLSLPGFLSTNFRFFLALNIDFNTFFCLLELSLQEFFPILEFLKFKIFSNLLFLIIWKFLLLFSDLSTEISWRSNSL